MVLTIGLNPVEPISTFHQHRGERVKLGIERYRLPVPTLETEQRAHDLRQRLLHDSDLLLRRLHPLRVYREGGRLNLHRGVASDVPRRGVLHPAATERQHRDGAK